MLDGKDMEELEKHQKNKGGRPPKEIKRTVVLTFKCTASERSTIISKAKISGFTLSEYLREMGLNGKIDRLKVLPKEVLRFTATLNHLAANLNQIARKRNGLDELNGIERVILHRQSIEVKELALTIKSYLK